MAITEPVLTVPGTGASLEFGNGSRAEIAVSGEQSEGEYAVVRWDVRAGDEPPMHTHSREDEMVFVVDGEITAFVGDARVDVGRGACAALPRGVPHTLRVKGDAASVIITLVPAGVERFFVPQSEADGDPANFGLEMLGPPPA